MRIPKRTIGISRSALTVGAVTAAMGLLLLWLTPRPTSHLFFVQALPILPPLWLLLLCHLLCYFAAGAAAGLAWDPCRGRNREAAFWRGITFLMWGILALSVWYILLFGKGLYLLSWFCLPLSALCTAIAAVCWMTAVRRSGLIAALCILWPLLLFLWQFLVLLKV